MNIVHTRVLLAVSMVSRLQWNTVLPNSFSLNPRLDRRAHYLSKHIPILHWDCSEIEINILSANKSINLHYLSMSGHNVLASATA